jgi:hypothetical protein
MVSYPEFPACNVNDFLCRSFVYMRNVFYGVSLDQKVPIVNEKSEILGALLVRIEPIAGGSLLYSIKNYKRDLWRAVDCFVLRI